MLTIGRLLLHCWYSLGRPVTIGTPMVLSVFGDWFSVPFVKNSQKTVKTAKMTIGVPIVTGLPRLYQQCNKNLPIVNKNLVIANRASAAHTIRHS